MSPLDWPWSALLVPPGCISIISEITTWSRFGFLPDRPLQDP